MSHSSASGVSAGRFTACRTPVVTSAIVRQEMVWGFNRLRNMQQHCPHLDGKPLLFRVQNSPETGAEIEVIPETTLDELRRRAREAQSGRFVYQNQRLLSRELTLRELRVPGAPAVKKGTLIRWNNGSCPHLNGETLQAVRLDLANAAQPPLWFLEEHVVRIKASLLQLAGSERTGLQSFPGALRSLRNNAGLKQIELASRAGLSRTSIENWEQGKSTPSRASVQALAKALGVGVKALKLPIRNRTAPRLPYYGFDGLFRDGDGRVVAYNFKRAGRESRIPTNRLYAWAEKMPRDLRHIFPTTDHLPWEDMLIPGTRDRWERVIRVEDLTKLETELAKTVHSGRPTKSLKTPEELVELHGGSMRNITDRVRVRSYLKTKADEGTLKSTWMPREDAKCNGRGNWPFPLRYDVGEVDRLLAGRNLLEVAREFALHGSPAERVPPVNGHFESRGEQPERTRRGRTPSKKTQEIYQFCYERLGKQKRRNIMRAATATYGNRAPKEPSHVTLFAKRYARTNNLPFPPNT